MKSRLKHLIRFAAVFCCVICAGLYLGNFALTVNAETEDPSYPIRETVRRTASDGSMINSGMLLLPGEFSPVDKQAVLDRINEIRLEACREGLTNPYTGETLTEADYTPVKWSSELEWIAQTRAAETVISSNGNRPYDPESKYETYLDLIYNGVYTDAENRALVYHKDNTEATRAIDLWYAEKQNYLDGNSSDDAHPNYYMMLFHPSVKHIGIGVFTPDADTEASSVVLEFSPYDQVNEDAIGVVGKYNQKIQVAAWNDITKSVLPDENSEHVHVGMDQQLKVYSTIVSTYSYRLRNICPEGIRLRAVPDSWKSSDESVLTVDENGMAHGHKVGTATVTITYGPREFSFDVTVTDHVDGRTEKRDVVKATRFSEGSYVLDTYCRDCGELINSETIIIPKLENDTCTDSDADDTDGEWTFTEDGDWFGWQSYLHFDSVNNKYIMGRVYRVTLPEDGRLQIDMNADAGILLEVDIRRVSADTNQHEFTMGSSDKAWEFSDKTDILKAGEYIVSMGYNRSNNTIYSYTGFPEGIKYFYHKLTFKALTEDEAAEFTAQKEAAAVEDMVGKLPEVDSLTLEDAAQVQAAADALEALSEQAKAKVSDESKAEIAAAVEKIKELRQQASEEEVNKAAAQGAENLISSLPDTAALTLDNEQAVNDAMAAYNALTNKQKSYVSSDAVDKLFEAVGKINELKDAQGQGGSGSGEGGSGSGEGGSGSGSGESGEQGGNSGSGSTSGTTPSASTSKISAPAEIMDLPAVKIAKPKAAKKAVTVKWKKVSKKNKKKIAGIEIQLATDRGFTDIVKTANGKKTKTSAKVKKLKSKKTYYIRIRAYKNINGVKHVSKWSSVKKVKVK